LSRAVCSAGGSDVFATAMPMADRLEITHVHASPEGDALFPPIDPTMWAEVSRVKHPAGPDDDAGFSVVTYSRR
jgi:dihydrofolate reductase